MEILSRAKSKVRRDGVSGLLKAVPPYLQQSYAATRCEVQTAVYERRRDTYSIYDEEWDLLVVLDGCRYDLLTEIADEYEFVSDSQPRYSPASSSREWLEANFDPRYGDKMAETAYVTGNPFTQELFDGSEFGTLDEVWRYAWDQSQGTIPPRPVTDRTVRLARAESPRQCVVHYMQPHFPALSKPELGGQINREQNVWIDSVWDQLEDGTLEEDTLWAAYCQNLRDVLDEVVLLLDNVDAKRVVITADHGNGFGEGGVYGHPGGTVHDVLRRVPWVRTSASDSGTHQPAEYDRESTQSVREKLSALGYISE